MAQLTWAKLINARKIDVLQKIYELLRKLNFVYGLKSVGHFNF